MYQHHGSMRLFLPMRGLGAKNANKSKLERKKLELSSIRLDELIILVRSNVKIDLVMAFKSSRKSGVPVLAHFGQIIGNFGHIF